MAVVKSAARVLRLLEYLDEVQRGVTTMEVARALRSPQSSTTGLLTTLMEQGFIRYRQQDRTYWPTLRVALLGQWVGREFFDEGGLIAAMEWLSRKTGQTVILGAERQRSVCYIHVIQATVPLRLHVPIGAERPLTRSGLGKVFLFNRTREDILRQLASDNLAVGEDRARPAGSALLREIEAARKRGHAASYDGFTAGAGVVAVPVPDTPNEPLALGIGGHATTIRENEKLFVRLLREAIRRKRRK